MDDSSPLEASLASIRSIRILLSDSPLLGEIRLPGLKRILRLVDRTISFRNREREGYHLVDPDQTSRQSPAQSLQDPDRQPVQRSILNRIVVDCFLNLDHHAKSSICQPADRLLRCRRWPSPLLRKCHCHLATCQGHRREPHHHQPSHPHIPSSVSEITFQAYLTAVSSLSGKTHQSADDEEQEKGHATLSPSFENIGKVA